MQELFLEREEYIPTRRVGGNRIMDKITEYKPLAIEKSIRLSRAQEKLLMLIIEKTEKQLLKNLIYFIAINVIKKA